MTFIINYTDFLYNRVLKMMLLRRSCGGLNLGLCISKMTEQSHCTQFSPFQHWCGAGKLWGQIIHFTPQPCASICRFRALPSSVIPSLHGTVVLIVLSNKRLLFVYFSLAEVSRFLWDIQALPNKTWRPKIFRWCCCHSTKLFVLQAHNKIKVIHFFKT